MVLGGISGRRQPHCRRRAALAGQSEKISLVLLLHTSPRDQHYDLVGNGYVGTV